ncbi:MAG: hypothetical protein EOM54_08700 [Clostridia bacterium]|nr:hypothetical protein [Clostridia bacterium]
MHINPCLRDKQCDQPVAYCGLCRGEVYWEDILYTWEGKHICTACMEDRLSAMTTREKAELLGAYPIRAYKL